MSQINVLPDGVTLSAIQDGPKYPRWMSAILIRKIAFLYTTKKVSNRKCSGGKASYGAMAGKLPSVTKRIEVIEAAIERMQSQSLSATGKRKEALERLIEEGWKILGRLKRYTLH